WEAARSAIGSTGFATPPWAGPLGYKGEREQPPPKHLRSRPSGCRSPPATIGIGLVADKHRRGSATSCSSSAGDTRATGSLVSFAPSGIAVPAGLPGDCLQSRRLPNLPVLFGQRSAPGR